MLAGGGGSWCGDAERGASRALLVPSARCSRWADALVKKAEANDHWRRQEIEDVISAVLRIGEPSVAIKFEDWRRAGVACHQSPTRSVQRQVHDELLYIMARRVTPSLYSTSTGVHSFPLGWQCALHDEECRRGRVDVSTPSAACSEKMWASRSKRICACTGSCRGCAAGREPRIAQAARRQGRRRPRRPSEGAKAGRRG